MNELVTTIEAWANVWGPALWRAAWQGGIALAAASAVAAWGRRLSPRVLCWIWRLACLKLLIAFCWFTPVNLAWLPASHRAAPAAIPALAAAEPGEVGEARESVASAESIPNTPPRPLPWMSLLLAIWLCGVGVRLTGTLRQARAIRALRRMLEPLTHLPVRELYADEAHRLGLRRLPELCQSRVVDSPLLMGSGVLGRATIVLPAGAAADYSEAELRMMLAHELAHHCRRDLLWNWLPTVAAWLFYFHPLVWWMGRRWPEAQEAACDELVLQRRALPPADYGRLLLRMAMQGSRTYVQTPLAAGVLGGFRNLERRILALTNVRPASPRALVPAVTLLALVAVPGLASWRLVAQEPAAPTAKKPTQPSAEVRPTAVQADAVFSLVEPLDEPAATKPAEPSVAHRAAAAALGKLGAHVTPFAPSGCAVLFGPEWKGTAAEVQRLAELDELRFVAVSDCRKLSDADWKAIRQLEGPLGVQLVEADDQDVAALAGWKGCNNVSVISNRLTAASVASIASLPNLAQVLIAGNMVEGVELPPLDDASLAPLAKCQKLERLVLTNLPRNTGTGLQALVGLPKLIALNLMQVALTDAGLAAICQLPHLEQLSLTMPEVTTAGYASLSKATRLTHLTLWDAKNFTGESAATLAPLNRLQMLSIDGAKLNDAAIAEFAQLKSLRLLALSEARITGRGLGALGSLTQLQVLSLMGRVEAVSAGLESLGGMTRLRVLSLAAPEFSDKDLSQLSGCINLRALDLSGSRITGTGFAGLKEATQLRVVTASDTQFSDEGLAQLAQFPNLQEIKLDNTQVTDAGLRALEGLKKLRDLNLTGDKITDAGLEALAAIKSLRSLTIPSDTVSSDAQEALKKQIPGLQIGNVNWTITGTLQFEFIPDDDGEATAAESKRDPQ